MWFLQHINPANFQPCTLSIYTNIPHFVILSSFRSSSLLFIQGFPSALNWPLTNASFKTAGQVEIMGHLPSLVSAWNFHLQEINTINTINCHRLIFLTKYNLNIPLLFHILRTLHIHKFPASFTHGSSSSNNNTNYLFNLKMMLVGNKPHC